MDLISSYVLRIRRVFPDVLKMLCKGNSMAQLNFQAWPARRQTKAREPGSSWVSPAAPWWHILGCLGNALRQVLSLVCQHVRQQVPRSGTHWDVLWGQQCLVSGGPRKVPEQGGLFGRGFCTNYCLIKATDSSSCRASGHIQ